MASASSSRSSGASTAAAKASGWPRDLLVFANTIPDLRKLGGCATLFVEAERSATGHLGHNALDLLERLTHVEAIAHHMSMGATFSPRDRHNLGTYVLERLWWPAAVVSRLAATSETSRRWVRS